MFPVFTTLSPYARGREVEEKKQNISNQKMGSYLLFKAYGSDI